MSLKIRLILVSLFISIFTVTAAPISDGLTAKTNTANSPVLLPKRQDANGGFTHISTGLGDLADDGPFQDFLNDNFND